MSKTTYMEGYVGVENILKLMRLYYVWRLNDKNHLNSDKRGIRVAIHLTF